MSTEGREGRLIHLLHEELLVWWKIFSFVTQNIASTVKKTSKKAKRASSFIRSSQHLLACPLNLTQASRMTSERIRTLFDSFMLNIHLQMGENIHYISLPRDSLLAFQSVLFNETIIFVIRKSLRKAIYGFLIFKFCFQKNCDTSWHADEFPLNFNFFSSCYLTCYLCKMLKKLRKWKSCRESACVYCLPMHKESFSRKTNSILLK